MLCLCVSLLAIELGGKRGKNTAELFAGDHRLMPPLIQSITRPALEMDCLSVDVLLCINLAIDWWWSVVVGAQHEAREEFPAEEQMVVS